MKKLFLTLVTCFVAIAANAVDYYLIGGFNNWTLKQANCKFTDQGDGTFVLDYQGTLTSGFKINDGTWSNANANFGGNATLQLGVTYSLTSSGTSGNIPLSENITNPHIVLNPTAKTLLITGQATAVEYTYGIHSGWTDSNWSTSNMTEQNGKWVLANQTVPAGSFGIKKMDKSTGSQVEWISADGNGVVVLDTPMPCKVEGTNFSNAAGTYTFTFDPEAMTLTVTGTQTGGDVKPDTSNWWVNLGGTFNGNDFFTQPSAQPVNGIATFSNIAVGDGTLKVKIWDGSNDKYYITENQQIAQNEWVQMVEDSYDVYCTITGATAGESFNIKYDVENNQIYVESTGGTVTPTIPETMYIIGNINGDAWNPTNVAQMTSKGEGVFTIESVKFAEYDGFTGFALTENKGSNDDDWGAVNANRFGPSVSNTKAEVGTNKVDGKGDVTWSIDPGTYSMTFNYTEKTLVIAEVKEDTPNPPTPPTPGGEVQVTFNFTSLEDCASYGIDVSDDAKKADGNNSYYTVNTATKDGITLVGQQGTATARGVSIYVSTATNMRVLSGNLLTVSAPEGGYLESIEFDCAKTATTTVKKFVLQDGSKGEMTYNEKIATWTAPEGENVNSVTFTSTGTIQINNMVVDAMLPEEEPAEATYALVGQIGTLDMTVENNVATYSGVVKPGTFHIVKTQGEATTNFGPDADANLPITKLGEFQAAENDLLWILSADVADNDNGTDLSFSFDLTSLNLTIASNEVVTPPDAKSIWVVGSGDGLTWDLPGMEVKANAEGNFVFTVNNLSKFKFATVEATEWDDPDTGFNANAFGPESSFSNKVANTGGETLPIVHWGSDLLTPWPGDYTVTINGDVTTMNLYTTTPEPQEAPAVYIRGDLDGNNWGAVARWQFTYNEAANNYTFNATGENILPAGKEFKVADADWGKINYGYGPGTVEVADEGETTIDLGFNNGTNLKMAKDFEGTITFTITGNEQATLTFEPSGTTGVEGIDAENGEAVFFNLQGVKVVNPEKGGIYIKVVNGKAEKVVL